MITAFIMLDMKKNEEFVKICRKSKGKIKTINREILHDEKKRFRETKITF